MRNSALSWNSSGSADDYLVMDCSEIRLSISANLDGEDPSLPPAVVAAHVSGCQGCRSWSVEATGLHRSVRVQAAPVEPDRTEAILAALPVPEDRVHDHVPSLRIATLVIAIVQVAAAIPLLLGHGDMMHMHYARHIGVFSAALAIGLLVAAWQPVRARGLLPVLAVVVLGLAWSCFDDLLAGRSVPGSAIAHAANVAGLAAVWMLAHTTPADPNSTPSRAAIG